MEEKKTEKNGKVVVSDAEADQLSPVALKTSVANPLSLQQLQWVNYDKKPTTVYARNTGFTVMIQASFPGEVPHLCSGPLTQNYKFSQIHFHWGEHDETGSGHSVDGIRYPLEMHVVHVKKDCVNLNAARGMKDGIAITVQLFALREERNTSLDQLTAILQFIKEPNCCAKLYPSSLSDIIHPFNHDYFLYWGSVHGSEQHYGIVWLVNRQLIPVSSQQLEQFRELLDTKGNFIWSNSNSPHPLGDRSLFLVSPSEKTGEAVFDESRRTTKNVKTSESSKSIEIENAEFKSLAVLQEAGKKYCVICPHSDVTEYKTKVQTEYSVKINEGDASIEQSCLDLGTLNEHEPVQTTKSTVERDEKNTPGDRKTTACGNCSSPKYIPSEEIYSVIVANEQEIHLKRKLLTVRKSDPSKEQACVFLSEHASVHSAQSAPSLTTWGYLGQQRECVDISNPEQTRKSSEILVGNKSLDSVGAKKLGGLKNEFKKTQGESRKISRHFADKTTQKSENIYDDEKEHMKILIAEESHPSTEVLKKHYLKEDIMNKFVTNEKDGLETEYLLVKQAEPKKSYYKIIGELLMIPDSKPTFVKRVDNRNKNKLPEINNNVKSEPIKEVADTDNNVMNKKIILSIPSSTEETRNNKTKRNNTPHYNVNKGFSEDRSAMISYPNPNQNIDEKKEDVPKTYYVTKITPLTKSQDGNPAELIESKLQNVERKLYYAQPITKKKSEAILKVCPSRKNHQIMTKQIDYNEEYETIITQPTNSLVDSNVINIKTTTSLENLTSSDHLIRKKVDVIVPYKNATETVSSTENQVYFTSSHNNIAVGNYQGVETPLHPPVKIQKPISNQGITNGTKQIDSHNMETRSSKHKELGDLCKNQSNNSNKKKKIKVAISIKSHGESAKPNDPKKLNTHPINGSMLNDRENMYTYVLGRSGNSVLVEENLEENTVYSQKSRKKTTITLTHPTYKLPNQPAPATDQATSSQHLVIIKKIEVPDPYYLARVPKPPLIVYEAFQTGNGQQVETTETEINTSEVKTIKTHTTVKKSNRKDENSIPIELAEKVSKGIQIDRSLCKDTKDNPLVKSSPFNHNYYFNETLNIHVKTSRDSPNKNRHSQSFEHQNEIKNTKIVVGSHQPSREIGLMAESVSIDENHKFKQRETSVQRDEPKRYSPNHQGQFTVPQNIISPHSKPENINFPEGQNTACDQQSNMESKEDKNQLYRAKIIYIDAATSNPSKYLPLTFQDVKSQQSRVFDPTDIEEEPTKDPGFETKALNESPQTQSEEEINAHSFCIKTQSTADQIAITSSRSNLTPNEPVVKLDESSGNGLVYMHQRDDAAAQKYQQTSSKEHRITRDNETKQENKSEKGVSHTKTPSDFRKSTSINFYQPPKSEELISTHDYENEKGPHSSHCNVTFKSEAKMELPDGQTAFVKSLAAIKFKPSRKSGSSNIPTTEDKSKVRIIKNNTEDKCCSTIDLRDGIEAETVAVDTSSSIGEDLRENQTSDVNHSPIRIKTEQTVVKFLPSLKYIDHWNRNSGEDALLENNGKTVRATVLTEDAKLPKLSGGPLEGDYIFAELHFHWGRKDCCGAEHIIDDQRFTMEAHFLYFKEEYKSVREALNHEDGLAMVAVQLNVGGPPHPLLDQLIRDLPLIKEPETGVYVPTESLFSWIKQTVEESGGYYSYKGTMTTEPPYVESVTWIIFKQPISFCCQQSTEFRKLQSLNGDLLLKTFRPSRPLNNRRVFFVPN